MILGGSVRKVQSSHTEKDFDSVAIELTYQRLVNTTPNPRATKNSRGELVGPPPPDPPPPGEVVAEGGAVDEVEGMVDEEDIVEVAMVAAQIICTESGQLPH